MNLSNSKTPSSPGSQQNYTCPGGEHSPSLPLSGNPATSGYHGNDFTKGEQHAASSLPPSSKYVEGQPNGKQKAGADADISKDKNGNVDKSNTNSNRQNNLNKT